MQIIRHLSDSSDLATAVAIGNFDGLHLGHRAVIKTMLRAARGQQLAPSVLTFEPHPRKFFKPGAPDFRIASLREKLAGLRNIGVQNVFVPRFDAAFASMQAEDFLNHVLIDQLGAKIVVTGENFVFGHRRGGTSARLKAWGAAKNIKIMTVKPVMVDDMVCSSSAVRTAITAGDMETATALLGRTHRLSGHVVHGDGRGRTIGFPTANITLPPHVLLPAYGVYAVRVMIDSTLYTGVANLGVRPTIGSYAQPTLEVHLFDMKQEIYGKLLQVSFVTHIRPEIKFDGVDNLRAQIAMDCESARMSLEAAA